MNIREIQISIFPNASISDPEFWPNRHKPAYVDSDNWFLAENSRLGEGQSISSTWAAFQTPSSRKNLRDIVTRLNRDWNESRMRASHQLHVIHRSSAGAMPAPAWPLASVSMSRRWIPSDSILASKVPKFPLSYSHPCAYHELIFTARLPYCTSPDATGYWVQALCFWASCTTRIEHAGNCARRQSPSCKLMLCSIASAHSMSNCEGTLIWLSPPWKVRDDEGEKKEMISSLDPLQLTERQYITTSEFRDPSAHTEYLCRLL